MVTMVEVVRRGQGLKWLGGGCERGWEVKEKAWLAMAAAVVQVEVWKRVLGSHGGFWRGVGGWFVAVWWFLEARMMVKRGWVAVTVRTIRPRWILFFFKRQKAWWRSGKGFGVLYTWVAQRLRVIALWKLCNFFSFKHYFIISTNHCVYLFIRWMMISKLKEWMVNVWCKFSNNRTKEKDGKRKTQRETRNSVRKWTFFFWFAL